MPSTVPRTPLPAGASNSATSGSVLGGGRRRPSTMARANGCSELDSIAPPSRSSSPSVVAVMGDDGDDDRLALGEGAGLVDHDGVDLLHPFERFGVLDEDSHLLPRPTPTMMDIGVARPRAHGQAMMRTRRRRSACASFGSGPTSAQTGNASTAIPTTAGTNHGRDLVGQPLDGCAGALGVGDHLHDAGQQYVVEVG